eukprot:PhM_4_TR4125/c0_g1_i1/m.18316
MFSPRSNLPGGVSGAITTSSSVGPINSIKRLNGAICELDVLIRHADKFPRRHIRRETQEALDRAIVAYLGPAIGTAIDTIRTVYELEESYYLTTQKDATKATRHTTNSKVTNLLRALCPGLPQVYNTMAAGGFSSSEDAAMYNNARLSPPRPVVADEDRELSPRSRARRLVEGPPTSNDQFVPVEVCAASVAAPTGIDVRPSMSRYKIKEFSYMYASNNFSPTRGSPIHTPPCPEQLRRESSLPSPNAVPPTRPRLGDDVQLHVSAPTSRRRSSSPQGPMIPTSRGFTWTPMTTTTAASPTARPQPVAITAAVLDADLREYLTEKVFPQVHITGKTQTDVLAHLSDYNLSKLRRLEPEEVAAVLPGEDLADVRVTLNKEIASHWMSVAQGSVVE